MIPLRVENPADILIMIANGSQKSKGSLRTVHPRLLEFLYVDLKDSINTQFISTREGRLRSHPEHWAEIVLRQHHFLAIAMPSFYVSADSSYVVKRF